MSSVKAAVELYTDGREASELIPLACRNATQLRKAVDKKKIVLFTNRSGRPLVTRLSAPETPGRGLSGRHIALWQSHGRYFDQTENRWKWQRSALWQTCEDLYTQSYVLPYLVPMLENAGACVLLPRERDVQKYEVLADNDNAGQYAEEGAWESGGAGFAHLRQVYHTGENPFRDGTTRRVRTVTGGATGRAAWQADIPERGEYAVYVSYESTPESADDARIRPGGPPPRRRDLVCRQSDDGRAGRWIDLGVFPSPPDGRRTRPFRTVRGRAGRIVSAPYAVKIGGGYAYAARTSCDSLRLPGAEHAGETSGYPRFCEGAAQPASVGGISGRGLYAEKQHRRLQATTTCRAPIGSMP